MTAERPRLLLLDGNSLTYRAFFGLPTDMVTASGQVTNAVFGFTSMLVTMLKDHRPSGLVVAFDRSEPTFRHEAEPKYKAQRESAPDILRQQLGIVREVLAALGVPVIEIPGFEADDIIATVADRAVDGGFDVMIVTGDRDSYQLVRDPHVRVLYNRRGVTDYALYDEAGILERTGVTPEQYPTYAALRGDPSDNLPGVPGVGEKTAAKLVSKYLTLDGIFAHASEQTPKLRSALEDHQDLARHNEFLMKLRHDAPVALDLADVHITPNEAELKRLFEFLEFKTMWGRLRGALAAAGVEAGSSADPEGATSEQTVLDVSYREARSAGEVLEFLSTHDVVDVAGAWDGEPGRTELLGVALSAASTMWVPSSLLADSSVARALSSHRVRGHDVKSLMRSGLAVGFDLAGLELDTAIAAYLLEPGSSDYSIGRLLVDRTDTRLPELGTPSGQLDLDGSAISPAQDAVARAIGVAPLATALAASLEADSMRQLYDDIENPLVRVLAKMEHVGIGVDVDRLREIGRRLTSEAERLGQVLQDLAGGPFNPNSPAQLGRILFEERGLTPPKKTKTGYSTDAATLEKLRDEWPEFIDTLLRYREFEKLRGTYGEGLVAEVAADGRIHATFNQTVARTGRLSSDHPNLHNIPVRSDEGRVFREAFVPAEGHSLLVADYNQIELRCIAHLADDPGLIDAFRSGRDVHRTTAAQVFGVEEADVNFDQRSKAKMVSYGLAYGMEAYGLAQRLAIPVGEAAEILDAYFTAFPNVRDYMDRTVNEARQRGYTETLFGRRRPIPELLNDNFRIRQAGERQAMNAGIQGLAADIFKVALVRIDRELERSRRRSRIVLQVHDEVIVEVPESERDEVGSLVIGLMERAAELSVPLAVNFAWGDSWAAAKG
ncbi:MAG: DNA polymerase I [Acidimicrobiales bacterium mtb01]|nr:DNA polymerase I [Actinomycetota bacterium]TEX45311.1 MAG: DNA polymerase I [Acidimicrobiales bacterium mtb01]